jgi:hypothetical protein
MALSGCGDSDNDGLRSSSDPVAINDSYLFPAGKATLVFSVISTTRLDAPVSGIDIAVTLPHGMSVSTTSGVSGQITPAAIASGPQLSGTNLSFGTYSASTGKIRLNMATTSTGYRTGELLRLTCSVAPNTNITLTELKALNSPVVVLKAVGYDPVSKNSVLLNEKLQVTLNAIN